MKGLFIPDITAEMFRNGCLESIEALMAEGEVYDIEYDHKSAQSYVPDANVCDPISRQAAIDALKNERSDWNCDYNVPIDHCIDAIYSVPPAQQWIPVKTRPMTEEERQYLEEHTGIELEDEDAVFFDCQMPDDGQEVWVCYKSGTVSEDVCEIDDFCGLEGNGDWWDIVAWMPRIKPEPYKEERKEE